MAVDVDSFLLDRLFQPASDFVAERLSNFALARAALVLAVESQVLVLLWDAELDRSAHNLLFCAVIAGLTVFGARQAWNMIMRAEKGCRPGVMNVNRITLRTQRMLWLVICTACSLCLLPQGDIRAGFAVLACAAWVALIYFTSCTPRPPAFRRSVRSGAAPAASPG